MASARIIVTTTRRPSPRTRSLVRDLVSVIPGAVRLTRGHMNYEELSYEAASIGAKRVLIIGTMRGNPSILRFYEPKPPRLENLGSLIIKGLTLSREARTGFSPPRGFEDEEIYVLAEDSEGQTPLVAEILLRGLDARVAGSRQASGIVAAVRTEGEYSILTFRYKGRRVGPKLKLVPTSRMVEEHGEQG